MLLKSRMRDIVEGNDSAYGKVFTLGVQLLIVLSLITFSIETLPGLSVEHIKLLDNIEALIVIIFTIEYGLRLLVAEKN